MSMTTSLWKVCRYSKAIWATRTHASGSSPLTWKIGACTVLATSLQYTELRAACGLVVKPIWLLMIRWIVPPTRYPLVSLIARHSATIPWPANAASPCIRIGNEGNEPGGSIWSWMARTMPSTIGSTVSRWLGLAASSRRMSAPDGLSYLPVAPRWYLTSPEPCTGVGRQRQQPVEDRDGRLGTLEPEALGAHVLGGEELLERLGGVEPLEDAVLLLLGGLARRGLHLLLDPALLGGLL